MPATLLDLEPMATVHKKASIVEVSARLCGITIIIRQQHYHLYRQRQGCQIVAIVCSHGPAPFIILR